MVGQMVGVWDDFTKNLVAFNGKANRMLINYNGILGCHVIHKTKTKMIPYNICVLGCKRYRSLVQKKTHHRKVGPAWSTNKNVYSAVFGNETTSKNLYIYIYIVIICI